MLLHTGSEKFMRELYLHRLPGRYEYQYLQTKQNRNGPFNPSSATCVSQELGAVTFLRGYCVLRMDRLFYGLINDPLRDGWLFHGYKQEQNNQT